MSPTLVLGAIDERIFSELLERHFAQRGARSIVLSRIRAELLKGELAEQVVEKGLTGDLLREKVDNEYNKEMIELLKTGFRSREAGTTSSLGDMYLEMLNSRIYSMPQGNL